MAEMTIRLSRDAATGQRTIVVKLESDPDATPLEHERQHRQLVERLIGAGVIEAEEANAVTIERVASAGETPSPSSDSGQAEDAAASHASRSQSEPS